MACLPCIFGFHWVRAGRGLLPVRRLRTIRIQATHLIPNRCLLLWFHAISVRNSHCLRDLGRYHSPPSSLHFCHKASFVGETPLLLLRIFWLRQFLRFEGNSVFLSRITHQRVVCCTQVRLCRSRVWSYSPFKLCQTGWWWIHFELGHIDMQIWLICVHFCRSLRR